MSPKGLFTVICVLMLTGCASSTLPPVIPQPQASLRERCPDLPALTAGDGKTVLTWTANAAKMYRECQSRHIRLVQAVTEK